MLRPIFSMRIPVGVRKPNPIMTTTNVAINPIIIAQPHPVVNNVSSEPPVVYPTARTSDAVSQHDWMPDLHSASPFLVWSASISAED